MVDLGCGGGLICEPLSRLGGNLTGLDVSDETVSIAREHAKAMGLPIQYRQATAEQLAEEDNQFDVVLALEVIEHVADPALFLAAARRLVKDDGLLIFSTLNRTAKSFALGIMAAEYVLGWVPRGTHDWKKFVTPIEFTQAWKVQAFMWGKFPDCLTMFWGIAGICRTIPASIISAQQPRFKDVAYQASGLSRTPDRGSTSMPSSIRSSVSSRLASP
ncbi:hypothetical protein JCM17843_05500 [Kordiimonadales bacterium JCM 17843]|nr:hypothetical protein JCM17843_05500 [Kordiimonadales bacterium JCM 17843]